MAPPPGGRVHNAADVNDVESTEDVRRALLNHLADTTVIQPFVYLRRDRPGRTASFIRYLNRLAARAAIERARIAGDHRAVFAYKADFPVIEHDEPTEDPASVLDTALSDGHSVILRWNSVPAFMQSLDREIEGRAIARSLR